MSSPSKETGAARKSVSRAGYVKALTNKWRCPDDQYALAGPYLSKTVHRSSPLTHRHAALQHYRLIPVRRQHRGKGVDVRDSSGEHEAVPPAPQGGCHIGDDLGVAILVGDESAVQFRERYWRRQVDIVGAESVSWT